MEKLTPEKVKEMLRTKGMTVSLEEADSILQFLRMLADIVVTEYIQNGKQ